jgi:SAM-dependent methyltransferase
VPAGCASGVAVEPREAERLAAAVAPLLPPALVPWFDARFVRSDRLADEYVSRLTVGVARETGLDRVLDEPGTAADVVRRAGLHPPSALVPVDWMLRRLAARGALGVEAGPDGPRFRARGPLAATDTAAVLAEQQRHDPAGLATYALAEAAARAYPAFLGGQRSGEELLLAPARLALWRSYFSNDHTLYAVNNRLGAVALTRALRPGPNRILELGGGLGSGATAALEALAAAGPGDVESYGVTERVPMFLRYAQRAVETGFPGIRHVTFAPLDIDRPFDAQQVPPGSVSIVYAVNTLHVAHDLAFTLGEIRRALEPGGRLVVAECLRPVAGQALYPEFVFNLLATFRAPRLDPAYRPHGGFLTPEQWRAAFEAAGFADVRILPDIARIREAAPMFSVGAVTACAPP